MTSRELHDHPVPETGAPTRDPVCGMTVDLETAKHRHTHAGRDFGFCSESCRARFEADPERYLTAKDPVCGMAVDRATARWMSKHEGQRYYFCSESCQQKFEAAPAQYLAGHPAPPPAPAGAKWT